MDKEQNVETKEQDIKQPESVQMEQTDLDMMKNLMGADNFERFVEDKNVNFQPKAGEEAGGEQGKEEVPASEEGKEEPKGEENKGGSVEFDNPFLKDLNVKKEEVPTFEKETDAFSFLEERTGLQIKEMNDLATLGTKYAELNESVTGLTEEKNKFDQFKNHLSKMPDDLFGLMTTWEQGGDYRAEMQKLMGSSIDLNKDFADHDFRKMLDTFYPDKFSNDEDYEDMMDNPKVKALLEDDMKSRYAKLKDEHANRETNYREQYEKQVQEYQKALESSINESISSLGDDAKFFDDKQKADIQQLMGKGIAALQEEYLNPDGSWKKDAASKLLFNKYGKEALTQLKKFVSNRSETKAKEDILNRSTKEGNPTKEQETDPMIELLKKRAESSKRSIWR